MERVLLLQSDCAMERYAALRPLFSDVLEIAPKKSETPSALDSPALVAWAWQESPAVAMLYRFAAVQVIEQLTGARRKAPARQDAPTIFLRS